MVALVQAASIQPMRQLSPDRHSSDAVALILAHKALVALPCAADTTAFGIFGPLRVFRWWHAVKLPSSCHTADPAANVDVKYLES